MRSAAAALRHAGLQSARRAARRHLLMASPRHRNPAPVSTAVPKPLACRALWSQFLCCVHRQTAQRTFYPLRKVPDSGGVGLALPSAKTILTLGIQFLTVGKYRTLSLGPLPMDARKHFQWTMFKRQSILGTNTVPEHSLGMRTRTPSVVTSTRDPALRDQIATDMPSSSRIVQSPQ